MLSLQVACGKVSQDSKNNTAASVNDLTNCMDCVLETGVINAKVADTNVALDDANSVMATVNTSSLLSDPSSFVQNKAFDNFVTKVNDLLAKVTAVKTKIDVNLAKLDPVLHAALILQLQASKDRLTKIQNDILVARDRLVAKIDSLRARIEAAIAKLPSTAQIVIILTGIDMKIYGFIDAAHDKLMEIKI